MPKKGKGAKSPPSKDKLSSKSSGTTKIEIDWRAEVTSEPMQMDDFRFEIAMIVESSESCFEVTERFRECVGERDSNLVQSLSLERLLEAVYLGDLSRQPLRFETVVLPVARLEMESAISSSSITTDLLALWLKLYLIIHRNSYVSHKINYRNWQNALDAELLEDEEIFEEPPVATKKKGKGGSSSSPKSSPKGKSKAVEKTVNDRLKPKKSYLYHQEMLRLGQSDHFVLPEDDFDIFYVLSGFYDPDFLEEMQRIGCSVRCLINFAEDLAEDEFACFLSMEPQHSPRVLEISNFWNSYTNFEPYLLPEHTFYVKYAPLTTTTLYDDLYRIFMNINDFTRQYRNYCQHLTELNFPEQPVPTRIEDMHVYHDILDSVPAESVNIPLVLFALVEEVCAEIGDDSKKTVGDLTPFDCSEDAPPPKKTHGGVRDQMDEVLGNFALPIQVKDVPKVVEVPYGDAMLYRTTHCTRSQDICRLTEDLLRLLPTSQLMQKYEKSNDGVEMLCGYFLDRWARTAEDVSPDEILHSLHAFLLKKGKLEVASSSRRRLSGVTPEDLVFYPCKPQNLDSSTRPAVLVRGLEVDVDVVERAEEDYDESVAPPSVPYSRTPLYETRSAPAHLQVIHRALTDCEVGGATATVRTMFCPVDGVLLLRIGEGRPGGVVGDNKRRKLDGRRSLYKLRTPINFRQFCGRAMANDIDWLMEEERLFWDFSDMSSRESSVYDIDSMIYDAPVSSRQLPSLATIEVLESTSAVTPDPIFESYPLPYPFQFEERTFDRLTADGLRISALRRRWPLESQPTGPGDVTHCSVAVCCEEDALYLNYPTTGSEDTPFGFHVQLRGGAVVAFGHPEFTGREDEPEGEEEERLITPKESLGSSDLEKTIQTVDYVKAPSKVLHPEPVEVLRMIASWKKREQVRFLRRKLIEAVRDGAPAYKILSSKKHRFRFVKRAAQRVRLTLGHVCRQVMFRPLLPGKKKLKALPGFPDYTRSEYNRLLPMDYEWRASLPTGLIIETTRSRACPPFYITQRYLKPRPDFPTPAGENFRCLLRGGAVLKLMDNGDAVVLHSDSTIRNVRRSQEATAATAKNCDEVGLVEEVVSDLEGHKMLPPVHAYAKGRSRLDRRLRRMNRRLRRHQIGIAGSHRFPSHPCRLPESTKTPKSPSWEQVLHPSGSESFLRGGQATRNPRKCYVITYMDMLHLQILTHREDGTTSLLEDEGKVLTQFPDGTRVTSWPKVVEDEEVLEEVAEEEVEVEHEVVNEVASQVFGEELGEYQMGQWEFGEFEESDYPEEEPFVMILMNYKYEHPCYATVEYMGEGAVARVSLPDDVTVDISPAGTYTINMIRANSVPRRITASRDSVVYSVETCQQCGGRSRCILVTSPLYESPRYLPDGFVLYHHDADNTVVEISYECDAYITTTSDDSKPVRCHCLRPFKVQPPWPRWFSLNADLSGCEYYLGCGLTSRYGDTLVDVTPDAKFVALTKTYTESLMMLYDRLQLTTADGQTHLESVAFVKEKWPRRWLETRAPLVLIRKNVRYLPQISSEHFAEIISSCAEHAGMGGTFSSEYLDAVYHVAGILDAVSTESLPSVVEVKPPEVVKVEKIELYKRIDAAKEIELCRELIRTYRDPEKLKELRYLYVMRPAPSPRPSPLPPPPNTPDTSTLRPVVNLTPSHETFCSDEQESVPSIELSLAPTHSLCTLFLNDEYEALTSLQQFDFDALQQEEEAPEGIVCDAHGPLSENIFLGMDSLKEELDYYCGSGLDSLGTVEKPYHRRLSRTTRCSPMDTLLKIHADDMDMMPAYPSSVRTDSDMPAARRKLTSVADITRMTPAATSEYVRALFKSTAGRSQGEGPPDRGSGHQGQSVSNFTIQPTSGLGEQPGENFKSWIISSHELPTSRDPGGLSKAQMIKENLRKMQPMKSEKSGLMFLASQKSLNKMPSKMKGVVGGKRGVSSRKLVGISTMSADVIPKGGGLRNVKSSLQLRYYKKRNALKSQKSLKSVVSTKRLATAKFKDSKKDLPMILSETSVITIPASKNQSTVANKGSGRRLTKMF